MYNYLQGILAEKDMNFIVVDVNGVGYELTIALSTFHQLPDIGNEVRIYAYLYVREDILKNYGFLTKEEKRFFMLLISISGLGPKVALSILSSVNIPDFKQAILEENIGFITKIPGIGKKSAERIILEIKSKLKELPDIKTTGLSQTVKSSNLDEDVVFALVGLGYKQSEAKDAFSRLSQAEDVSNFNLEEMIRKCLSYR